MRSYTRTWVISSPETQMPQFDKELNKWVHEVAGIHPRTIQFHDRQDVLESAGSDVRIPLIRTVTVLVEA